MGGQGSAEKGRRGGRRRWQERERKDIIWDVTGDGIVFNTGQGRAEKGRRGGGRRLLHG